MKHIQLSYLATIFAAMTIVSCSNDITEQTSTKSTYMVPMTFTATQESSDDITRTVVSNNGKYVNWQSGDAVTVFDGSYTLYSGDVVLYNSSVFTAESGFGTTSATLSGGTVYSESQSYIAVYPVDQYNDITPSVTPTGDPYTTGVIDLSDNNNSITIDGVTIPENQTAVADSYDPQAAVMTAVATKTNPKFAFKNVCAFLKITITDPYQKVTLSVSSGYIGGYGAITNCGSDPSFAPYPYKEDYKYATITLAPSSGTMTNGTYYIAVAPGTIKDIIVRCYTSDTEYEEKTITGDFTLKRSYCYSLGSMGTSNLLDGAYSVSATKTVMFTKGNLYWNGRAYHLESSQIGSSRDASTGEPTFNTSHVSYFYWTNATDYLNGKNMPYASTAYAATSESTTDKFWCGIDNPLTVDGTSNLYVLTNDEWIYLINKRANASSLYKYNVTVTDGDNTYTNCLIIAPDAYDYTTNPLKDSYTLSEIVSLGVTCLPHVGNTIKTTSNPRKMVQTTFGCYCSASPSDDLADNAYNFYWEPDDISTSTTHSIESRFWGQCIRLVWTYSDTSSGN